MKSKLLLIIPLVLILSINITYSQKAKQFVKAAEEFAEAGNYGDAYAQYTSAINMEPSNWEFYLQRGLISNKLGNFDNAILDIKRAITFEDDNHELYYYLGSSYNLAEKYDSALKVLNIATKLKWTEPRIYPEKIKSLIPLKLYSLALEVSDTAIRRDRANPEIYYLRGQIYELLQDKQRASKEYEDAIKFDRSYIKGYVAYANVLVDLKRIDDAMDNITKALGMDDKNPDAYYVRSRIYAVNLDYPLAINDLSKNIVLQPETPKHYINRGKYYQEFNQHTNAINDFTKAITLKEDDPDAYLLRAKSYEEILNLEKAARDYQKITELSEYNVKALKLLDQAHARIYEINREEKSPEIFINEPIIEANQLKIAGNRKSVILSGKLKEDSELLSFTINGNNVRYEGKPGEYKFLSEVDIEAANTLEVVAVDTYHNEKVITIDIQRMETDPPFVKIFAPYASDDNQIYLETNNTTVYLQGQLLDASPVKSIFIEGVTASYKVDELNPEFTAAVSVANKTKIDVSVEDIYGNKQTIEYKINREGALISEQNPMGKTWVVFIENSQYESFASLDGPVKDINLMKQALSAYSIHNVIVKKDMDKDEMEKFFSIELRDLVRKNQVKSLMVWYAGHGKFINNVGYWIPVDAKRDDEFTYFNINSLRAGMQGYTDILIHTLIVTDACESGPSFYTAMRSDRETPNCGDWQSTRFKSSQVFSSAGYELAVDDSQFTRTFASSLINNPNQCIPIESIVDKVSVAVKGNNQQEPMFGKIKGFEDEDGTFFFISKE